MSCHLLWRPVGECEVVGDFSLRNAIQDEFGLPCKIGHGAIPFLRGLRAAGIDGAGELIERIEQLGVIELYKEC